MIGYEGLKLTFGWSTDDIEQRVGIMFILACLVGYTTNIISAFSTTYSQLIAFYLTARLFVCLVMLWMSYLIPMVRAMMIANTVSIAIPGMLWIGSMYVEEPSKEALVWIAICLVK